MCIVGPVPPVPSATEASPTVSAGGGSSSTIVPVALAVAIVAFTGVLIVAVTVSSGSSRASGTTGTSIVFEVSPGANVSVPLTGVKSVVAVAVPAVTA